MREVRPTAGELRGELRGHAKQVDGLPHEHTRPSMAERTRWNGTKRLGLSFPLASSLLGEVAVLY